VTPLRERILVLDDEASILELLGQLLSDTGYDCTLTTSAFRALKLLEQEEFAVLTTGLNMPDMYGYEVVWRAKQLRPDISVVVITASCGVKKMLGAYCSGADDYVIKPFNLSEVTLAVENALGRWRVAMAYRQFQQDFSRQLRAAGRKPGSNLRRYRPWWRMPMQGNRPESSRRLRG
jgi:DNA-binding NtrC family response regulator